MKNYIVGLLLTFQFFTSLPIRKELSMNRHTVTSMYAMLPVLGLLMGGVVGLFYLLNGQFLHLSPLLLTILIVIAGIVMTGGLHLDGWIDLGDAYFSYQDKNRRLEILEDSRVGAFGAISLVVLLLLKIGFIYEALIRDNEEIVYYFIIVPFLSRMALLVYFLISKPVKEKGLAFYFKSQVIHKNLWMGLLVYTVLFSYFIYSFLSMKVFLLLLIILLIVFLYQKWTVKNFGGMTGDLLGALYEGIELLLWAILLLFI